MCIRDRYLYGWGFNQGGQLGLGFHGPTGNTCASVCSPAVIGASQSWGLVTSTGVSGPSFAVKCSGGNGTLWAWGYDGCNSGTLGLGNGNSYSSPVQVGSMTNWSTQPGHLTSVNSRTFAIKKDGTLWAWGQNSSGELGLNNTTNRSSPTQLGNDYWRWVTAGQFSLAIKTDGSLWGWGYNYAGILKSTNINGFISSPVQIGSDNNWATVISGYSYNALATKLDGTLWAVGYNGNGQLGLNDTVDRSNFTQIGTSTWVVASIGTVHSLAIDTYGRLYSWGYNAKGSLGLGDTLDRSSPTQVGSLTSWKFAKAGGNWNSIAITSNGHLYAWGFNSLGQTGLGIIANSATPSPTQVGSAPFRWANLSSQSNGSEFAILSPFDPPY